jgi:putative endonuclease
MCPVMEKDYFVYILANRWNLVLYTGITSDLVRRVFEHREKLVEGFTRKYNVYKLIYYEVYTDVMEAIAREKQIKGYSRKKKAALIEKTNSKWNDLYDEIVK